MKDKGFVCTVEDHDFDDFPRPVQVSTAKEAAEEFAYRLCCGDPDWYSSFERGMQVRVRDKEGKVQAFQVYLEAVPSFHAVAQRGGAQEEGTKSEGA